MNTKCERVKLARDEERQHDTSPASESPFSAPCGRREFELWIHRDGNAAALVAIEVELPADRSRPDAGLVTLSGLIGGGNRVLHDSRDQLLMCVSCKLLIPSLMEERWELKEGFALHCSWLSASA